MTQKIKLWVNTHRNIANKHYFSTIHKTAESALQENLGYAILLNTSVIEVMEHKDE